MNEKETKCCNISECTCECKCCECKCDENGKCICECSKESPCCDKSECESNVTPLDKKEIKASEITGCCTPDCC